MTVRTFTMPTSLNESLAASQPPNSETDRSPMKSNQQSYSNEQREPLASHKPDCKPGITFAAQDKLPKLPIPDLEGSLKKYVEALKPLQSSREQEETAAAVADFSKHDGLELQARLKKYATGKTRYDSYLNFDNPVVLNLNPFFLLEDDPTPARNNQVTRAASLVVSSLSFVRAVRREELPPDTIRGSPLCMYQYSRLFGTARVPTDNGCQIAQDSGAKHIVVLCKGQFYWFDVLDDNSDLIMTEKDMALNLQVVVDDAEQTPIHEAAKGALGVLSTENRKIWAGLRDVLTRGQDTNNAECLSIVDSALFILCLDYTEPLTGPELCGNMLCGTSEVVKGVQIGTCTNRWYDKLQIIVCKNGSAGINFEHTGVDGHTVLRMASDVYTDTILRFAKSINGQAPSLWASMSPDPSKRDPDSFGEVSTTPHKLEWNMLPELSTALRFAETRLADLIQQNEFQTLDFSGYGKNFMTSMGFSPDAFVQMAFQAAYYGLYGRVENTYEPAMTKVFLHGRTEAVRSTTAEAYDFVKTFWGSNPSQQKIEALRKATQKHTANTKECAKALGQDRHLYALYCVWQRAVDEEGAEAASSNGMSSNGYSSPADNGSDVDLASNIGSPNRNSLLSEDGSPGGSPPSKAPLQQMPALFADPGWDKINNTILSTSNCGNPSLRQFGFGPTSGDGFGIGYIIKEDSISICASSKHRQTRRFVDALESYLLEIRKLLRATQQKTTSPKMSRAREAEGRPSMSHAKSKGRVIKADGGKGQEVAVEEEKAVESDDDGLGGYGFFDAGMLLQALKASQEEKERPSDRVVKARRAVGKKLRLKRNLDISFEKTTKPRHLPLIAMTTSTDPDHFFQTTHSLAEISRRAAKSRNDFGHPIRLPSKILAVIADPTTSSSSPAVYVAESAGTARRVLLDEGSIDHIFTGPPAPLTSLALSPDGKTLFAGCWDKRIWSWAVSTRAKGKRYVGGHTDFVKCVLCVRIAGKDVLISGGADAALVVWDVETGNRLHTLRSHIRGIQDLALDPLTYDPSTEQVTIFSAGSVGEIRRWDISITHATEIEKEKPIMVHETSVYKLLFDGDGDLWSASADGSVNCLGRERGKGWEVEMSVEVGGWVRGVGVEDVGGWVVAGGRDERVGVWSIGTGKLDHMFEGHYDEITGLVVMGQTVVSVSLDGTIRRWSLKAGDLDAAKKEAQEEKEGGGLEKEEKVEERLMTEEEEKELAELMDEDEED